MAPKIHQYSSYQHNPTGVKMKLFNVLLATILVVFLSTANAANETYGSLKVKEVVNVYDGDSFRVNIKNVHPLIGDNIGIRVYGIDTPEMRAKCPMEKQMAIKVRDYVRTILDRAKKVELRELRRDKYFRINAVVVVDGRSLAAILISNGMARQYFGGTKQGWCS